MPGIQKFAAAGGLVLGICNGFQVLLEAGLLPGAMLRNASLQFRSEWVWCRVERTDTAFTSACTVGQVLHMPIAHGEGNYVSPVDTDPEGVVLRYCDADGNITMSANPNGSRDNIAGLINAAGNVFGLMPHPEHAVDGLIGAGSDGLKIFESLASAAREPAADLALAKARGYATQITVEQFASDGRHIAGEAEGQHAAGVDILPCPEQTRGVSCTDCRLCFDDAKLRDRGYSIAFEMHGTPFTVRQGLKALRTPDDPDRKLTTRQLIPRVIAEIA